MAGAADLPAETDPPRQLQPRRSLSKPKVRGQPGIYLHTRPYILISLPRVIH